MTPHGAPSGWVADRAHHFPVRVYFEDTDAGGVVYHATYLRYAERARTEFLRAAGVPHQELMAGEGLVFVVRSAAIEYHRPARLDDSLVVVTHITMMGRASVTLDQCVLAGNITIASMRIGLVCTDLAKGGARRIPGRWRDLFASLLDDGDARAEAGTGR